MSDKKESKKAGMLRARRRAIKAEIDDKRKRLGKVEQELAEELAVFKIGDRVYLENKPAIIVGIKWSYSDPNYHVRRVKKNGQLYTNTQEAWSLDYLKPRDSKIEGEETIEEREERLKV